MCEICRADAWTALRNEVHANSDLATLTYGELWSLMNRIEDNNSQIGNE